MAGWRDNAVSLVIRSNFKSDLKLGAKMMIYDYVFALIGGEKPTKFLESIDIKIG